MMRFVLPCDRLPWEAAWNRVYWRNFDQFDARHPSAKIPGFASQRLSLSPPPDYNRPAAITASQLCAGSGRRTGLAVRQGCGLLECGGWTPVWTRGVRHNLRLTLQRAEQIMEHHAAKDYWLLTNDYQGGEHETINRHACARDDGSGVGRSSARRARGRRPAAHHRR